VVNRLNLITTAITISASLLASNAISFTLVSGKSESKLDASPSSPKIIFHVSPTPPKFSSKDKFMDGLYTDASDTDIWDAILKEAMKKWNEIPEAYIEIDYTYDENASLNNEDYVHSIVLSSTNLSSSAFAKPRFENSVIYDCDITMSTRSGSAEDIAYTLLHELGHCLGLGHNHSDLNSVMGYARQNRSLSLGADDVAGLIYLYPGDLADAEAKDLLLACGSIGTPITAQQARVNALLALLLPFVVILMWRLRLTRMAKKIFS
jgi:hypothetical protein